MANPIAVKPALTVIQRDKAVGIPAVVAMLNAAIVAVDAYRQPRPHAIPLTPL
jgi:hypothetical protein